MSPTTPSYYTTERARLQAVLEAGSFLCNIRSLASAYPDKNYLLRYSVPPALHATDILPTFYNLNLNLSALPSLPLIPGFGGFATSYQSYLTSHARTGDPNTFKRTLNVPPAIRWPKPGDSGDAFTGVLDATAVGFRVVTDEQTRRSRCEFWTDVAAGVTSLGGYAPPGSVVESGLVGEVQDSSANY
ncbi:MAG: hypothetical protein Q9183_008082 [Haloplaca sp. 2 TL-2023]